MARMRLPRRPTSPWSLNPVERVWLYLKQRFLSHRLLADYDAIVDAASSAWNNAHNSKRGFRFFISYFLAGVKIPAEVLMRFLM
jgi:transposase